MPNTIQLLMYCQDQYCDLFHLVFCVHMHIYVLILKQCICTYYIRIECMCVTHLRQIPNLNHDHLAIEDQFVHLYRRPT